MVSDIGRYSTEEERDEVNLLTEVLAKECNRKIPRFISRFKLKNLKKFGEVVVTGITFEFVCDDETFEKIMARKKTKEMDYIL